MKEMKYVNMFNQGIRQYFFLYFVQKQSGSKFGHFD